MSIRARVLNLLKSLQRELGLTYVFVAHNMGVVEHISDRVAVMYLGQIVELADRRDLFRKQEHPYTEALMSAIPVPNPELRRQRIILKGDVPSPLRPPDGCRFHPRCQLGRRSATPRSAPRTSRRWPRSPTPTSAPATSAARRPAGPGEAAAHGSRLPSPPRDRRPDIPRPNFARVIRVVLRPRGVLG